MPHDGTNHHIFGPWLMVYKGTLTFGWTEGILAIGWTKIFCIRHWLNHMVCIRHWLNHMVCIRHWLNHMVCIRHWLNHMVCIRHWLNHMVCIRHWLNHMVCIRHWLNHMVCIRHWLNHMGPIWYVLDICWRIGILDIDRLHVGFQSNGVNIFKRYHSFIDSSLVKNSSCV